MTTTSSSVVEAISEAASRPTMRSVVVKTVDQQADGIILKHHKMLMSQRTQAINALHRADSRPCGIACGRSNASSRVLSQAVGPDNVRRKYIGY
jgi:transposase